MNKDQSIKSFLEFIETNEFQDDVRICLSSNDVKAPNVLIQSILKLLREHHVKEEILYSLKLKASSRPKLPFELHYTDGYRSWYLEKRVKGANAFYWGDWLISLSDTGRAAFYDETEDIAHQRYYLGVNPQLLSASFYKNFLLPHFKEVNAFLKLVGGDEFLGADWCQKEGDHCEYVDFPKGIISKVSATGGCLLGRPAIKL